MRYLIQFFVMLWRGIALPSRGRHARPALPPGHGQLPRRLSPVRRCWEWEDPPTIPLQPADPPPERDLIPLYYRAFETERDAKRVDRSRLGVGVLQAIAQTPPPPRPSGELDDLAAVVRQWQAQGVRA